MYILLHFSMFKQVATFNSFAAVKNFTNFLVKVEVNFKQAKVTGTVKTAQPHPFSSFTQAFWIFVETDQLRLCCILCVRNIGKI